MRQRIRNSFGAMEKREKDVERDRERDRNVGLERGMAEGKEEKGDGTEHQRWGRRRWENKEVFSEGEGTYQSCKRKKEKERSLVKTWVNERLEKTSQDDRTKGRFRGSEKLCGSGG
jgi:hypothetical protein